MYLKKNYFEYGASENIKNQSLYASLTGTLKQKKKITRNSKVVFYSF